MFSLGLVFGLLAFLLALAFAIETAVEAIITDIGQSFPAALKFKWVSMYVAIGLGIYAAAFLYKFDVFYLLGQALSVWLIEANAITEPLPIPMTLFGRIFTGFMVGKGSNYLHDFIKKFQKPDLPYPGK